MPKADTMQEILTRIGELELDYLKRFDRNCQNTHCVYESYFLNCLIYNEGKAFKDQYRMIPEKHRRLKRAIATLEE